MRLFSIEPKRKPYTKWVLLVATLIVAGIALLLMAVSAGCASAPERYRWTATFRLEVQPQEYGNRPRRIYETDANGSVDVVPCK